MELQTMIDGGVNLSTDMKFVRWRGDVQHRMFYISTFNLRGSGSVTRWALGCVNSCPAARGTQEAGFTQPRAHLLAERN